MKPNQTWRHKNFRCCTVEILRSFYVKEKRRYNVKIEWCRLYKDGSIRSMGFTQRINIQIDDLDNWERLS